MEKFVSSNVSCWCSPQHVSVPPSIRHWRGSGVLSIVLLSSAASLYAQSLPPLKLSAPTPSVNRASATHCGNSFLPLVGCDTAQIKEMYQVKNSFSVADQVNFLYGFRQQTKTLSSDLATMLFPNGVRVALGASVTGGQNQGSTPLTPAGNQTAAKDTVSQAVDRLKAGGDFFISAAYPLANFNVSNASMQLMSVSKLGFNFSGLGSENTITQANERMLNTSVAGYGEYKALDQAGSVFMQFTTGLQNLQADLARQTHLPNNFLLSQVAIGIRFAGKVRVSAQRFFGPAQAFGVQPSELSKWHLVVQFERQESK